MHDQKQKQAAFMAALNLALALELAHAHTDWCRA
jgi:hypothetical protein